MKFAYTDISRVTRLIGSVQAETRVSTFHERETKGFCG